MTNLERRLNEALTEVEELRGQVVKEINDGKRRDNLFESELAIRELGLALAHLQRADLSLFPGRRVYVTTT